VRFSLLSCWLAIPSITQNARRSGPSRSPRSGDYRILLGISSAVSIYAISRVSDPATRFTLKRIKRLLVFLLAIFVAVSVLFVNWYTALISVGVISVIAGLAVQTPMTSFIGWIYLLVRQPYRVGDRIKISDATGDVIDVGYLDTTLWEFGGDYISGDHPSGRIIRFPNSKVLNSIIYNYSWRSFLTFGTRSKCRSPTTPISNSSPKRCDV
jgi:small-conductance mechanosensitive channel